MISLQQNACGNFEFCRRGTMPASPEHRGPCPTCPAARMPLAKVHQPAAELGAGWALGRIIDEPSLGEGCDAD